MNWISVKDRIPAIGGQYIVSKDGFGFSAEFVPAAGGIINQPTNGTPGKERVFLTGLYISDFQLSKSEE